MKTSRNAIRFEAMPKDYAGLCGLLLPRPIHDKHELDNVAELAEAMAGHKLNRDQSDYFALLCKLIEDYEQEQVPVSEASGLDALRHLLAEHGLSGADLSKMLGAHRTLGPMILRGERKLTANHIRILSSNFGVSADLFL
jgi:HTH-type transcriptional regulator / antitoxin HigA